MCSRFVLNRFVRRSVLNKTSITIKIVDNSELDDDDEKHDLRVYKAWMTYDGLTEERKYFTIIVNRRELNTKSKKPYTRLYGIFASLAHELVHVKQYLNNEMFDYVGGDVRFKGNRYDASYGSEEESYFESPWEIEAYGREMGLVQMFKTFMKSKGEW